MSSPPPDGSPISPLFAQLWRRSRPKDAELAQAYARFQRRTAPRRRATGRDVVAWIGAGMLAGMGSLYAATAAHERWHTSPPLPRASASPAQAALPKRRPVAVSPSQSAPPPVSAPDALPEASGSALPGAEVPSAETWQRAARGLRESDFDAAEDALLKLARQGTPAERDIAKLVRAQVLLRQQRAAEAKVLLLELAHGSASATARRKSALLLEQWWPTASSHRSFESDAGTDSP
jgi:hypothetical protein